MVIDGVFEGVVGGDDVWCVQDVFQGPWKELELQHWGGFGWGGGGGLFF